MLFGLPLLRYQLLLLPLEQEILLRLAPELLLLLEIHLALPLLLQLQLALSRPLRRQFIQAPLLLLDRRQLLQAVDPACVDLRMCWRQGAPAPAARTSAGYMPTGPNRSCHTQAGRQA